MQVIDKYEKMMDAICEYVDAEIAEHRVDLSDIDDDAILTLTGRDLKKVVKGIQPKFICVGVDYE